MYMKLIITPAILKYIIYGSWQILNKKVAMIKVQSTLNNPY